MSTVQYFKVFRGITDHRLDKVRLPESVKFDSHDDAATFAVFLASNHGPDNQGIWFAHSISVLGD